MPSAVTTRVWKPLQRRLSRREGISVSMTRVPSGSLRWTSLSGEADEILPMLEFVCSKLIEPDQRKNAWDIEFQVRKSHSLRDRMMVTPAGLAGSLGSWA